MAGDPRVSEWGNPPRAHRGTPPREGGEPTRGTETSKYPEEKKERSIPPVVAIEKGRAQTGPVEAGPGL